MIDPRSPDRAVLARAGALIRAGRLVAFPTETVYGLGANALDAEAVSRIFDAKGRADDDPLIVHLAAVEQVADVARDVPTSARALGAAFWPGPLTIVLPKRSNVPDRVTAGLPSVAVRVPDHPIAFGLLDAAGLPIAAPSANLFTRISPTTAQHVVDDLGERVDLILDGGPTSHGIESTVVDASGGSVRLLRPGAVPAEEIARVLAALESPVPLEHGLSARSASPGLMKKHYAPSARVLFFSGPAEVAREALRAAGERELAQGHRIGLLICDEDAASLDALGAAIFERLGPCADLPEIASRLYAGLRTLDAAGVDVICVREFGPAGLGLAILDRLTRAANHHVIHVR